MGGGRNFVLNRKKGWGEKKTDNSVAVLRKIPQLCRLPKGFLTRAEGFLNNTAVTKDHYVRRSVRCYSLLTQK